MLLVDHLFVFLLFVVQPIHGAYEFRGYQRKIAAGEAPDRAQFYRLTLIAEWLAFAVLAITWAYFGRPIADLGFTQPGGSGFWIAATLLLLSCGFLVHSWRRACTMSDAEKQTQVKSLGFLVHFLPHSVRDLSACRSPPE